MIVTRNYRISADKLRWRCNPELLSFETTDEIAPLKSVMGQERALASLRLGLEIKAPGYNVCVVGLTGTGRTTIIQSLLKGFARGTTPPNDILYVNNFGEPDQPRVAKVPAGKGRRFAKDVDRMLKQFIKKVPELTESKKFKLRQKDRIAKFTTKETQILEKTEATIKKRGFAVVQVGDQSSGHHEIMPLIKGVPTPMIQLDKKVEDGEITLEQAKEFQEAYDPLKFTLLSALNEVQKYDRMIERELQDGEVEYLTPMFTDEIAELRNRYPYGNIAEYLDEVLEALPTDIDAFKNPLESGGSWPESLQKYRVNVVVDNGKLKTAPVIVEKMPTFLNLFGSIERKLSPDGQPISNFMNIRAGSIMHANGGFLAFNLNDALTEGGVWKNLKRALKHKQVTITDPVSMFPLAPCGLKPEPVDLDLKVVLIGDDYSYELLCDFDEDFLKIFKVKAEFDDSVKRTTSTVRQYAAFIKKIADEENLLPFRRDAVAELVEYGVKRTEWKKKITVRLGEIADIAREASYWCKQKKAKIVCAEHVLKALNERIARSKLNEEHLQELLLEDFILVETFGRQVGQVNGLSVFQIGDYMFGKPAKVTAVTSPGRSGIINIEREVKLSGKTHDKGVLILEGYLRERYAQKQQLSLTASLCFEQSYSFIEGDSASSTEIYALLSGLAGLPIRQDIAVTGSVSQKGDIQPIGGVNEKIKGFYELCKARGLTGTQGVMIPRRNVKNLMLEHEIIDAVKAEAFSIFAVNTVDEGIELLTGVSAGKMDKDGGYPPDSVNGLVYKKLQEFSELLEGSEGEEGSGGNYDYEPDETKPSPARSPDWNSDAPGDDFDDED